MENHSMDDMDTLLDYLEIKIKETMNRTKNSYVMFDTRRLLALVGKARRCKCESS